MTQFDFVGDLPDAKTKEFRDVRNTRATVAQEKAFLVLRLHRLAQYCPKKVRDSGVMETAAWVARQSTAKKVAAKKSATVPELTTAIGSLEAYLDHDERVRFISA